MMDIERSKPLLEHFYKASGLGKLTSEKETVSYAPFFTGWFEKKLKEIIENYPDEVEREGIPKGEKFPVTKAKGVFALFKTFLPSLHLKKFALATGKSYGVIRIWNIEDAVAEEVVTFAIELFQDFIKEAKAKYKSNDLIEFYKLMYQADKIQSVPFKNILRISITAPMNEDQFFWREIAWCGFKEEILKNTKDFKDWLEGDKNILKKAMEKSFADLSKDVKKGNTKKALAFIKNDLQPIMLNIIESRYEARLAALDYRKTTQDKKRLTKTQKLFEDDIKARFQHRIKFGKRSK